MSDQNFNEAIRSLFDGMNAFMSTKTVVGEPVHVQDALIIPLIDVSFGVGAGNIGKDKSPSTIGGLGGKMSPTAVLVVRNGTFRIIDVQNNDFISKLIDMAPELINKITGKDDTDRAVDAAAENLHAEEIHIDPADVN
ncbi:MAG: sporulation protein [Lachnospiraceae bacterium]|nr:sporulation protein [Lachnospiraceae bacterium]